MDSLPDELLHRIFSFLVTDAHHLLQLQAVCRRFCRIAQDTHLWYHTFQSNYPTWSQQIPCNSQQLPLIDWKDFMLHITRQNTTAAKSLSFEMVPDEEEYHQFLSLQQQQQQHSQAGGRLPQKRKLMIGDEYPRPSCSTPSHPKNAYRKLPPSLSSPLNPTSSSSSSPFPDMDYPPPFRIQDPLVVDVDKETKQGIVATGKHRRIGHDRAEHKFLFWEYPSWRLIREFDLHFGPLDTSCQITGIQTVRMAHEEKVRLFSLAVGQPLLSPEMTEDDSDDRVDQWRTILVYRLYDNGTTQCLAHLALDGQLLGRDVFFFSETSWGRPNEPVKDWIHMTTMGYRHHHHRHHTTTTPDHYDPDYTVFMLVMGPDFPSISGCGRLIRFDIRGERHIVDPATEPVIWEPSVRLFRPLYPRYMIQRANEPCPPSSAVVLTRINMGHKVSCMIFFRHPPELNHLICTGSYDTNELTLYDWRFGVKVGTLQWNSSHNNNNNGNATTTTTTTTTTMEDEDEDEIVQPWGFESTIVLPPYWSNHEQHPCTSTDFVERGLRLIAVGDNRNDKLEVKVWDIAYLLETVWRPLQRRQQQHEEEDEEDNDEIMEDYTHVFPWWKLGTPQLKRLGLKSIRNDNSDLPYTPRKGSSIILEHTFERDEHGGGGDDDDENGGGMPIKFIAYNVLRTSLFLLTEEGKIMVMDIETGRIMGSKENVAAIPGMIGPQRQVRGIDVNVVGGREIVVTSRQGLLRGVMA
ncbi:hypothetical protein O0I10_001682 [Lichtheimia ornata]|uniref:F-box domain-containing protein n=1 Tax=Lichtheimia ornata TaxID=688661 RepID=A0AAD7VB15_9FUNG|nr:uncharacterized protein O0I10_001682 [Lichtheimia ornata]KAJ8662718.1 hypothetical protein O0I10_001682 [Lichtheimia ornata]